MKLTGIETTCPQEHRNLIEPVHRDEQGYVYWPSAREYCRTCEQRIVHSSIVSKEDAV